MKKRKIELDPPFLDEEERDIIEAFNRGEFKRADDFEERKRVLEQAAGNTLKKRAINIRLQERDIGQIKELARRDGIPYQTLIASIVHRYAEGTLKRAD